MTESLPEMPRKYLDFKAPRSYMKVHTSGEVQRFFATANTDPLSMAQPWGDAFEPRYYPLVSTAVGSERDGIFGAIYVELVLNVSKSGRDIPKNDLLGGFGNMYITATFDPTFNCNYPPGALVQEGVLYHPLRDWHAFPQRKPGVPIPPELYPLIAKELATHKHLKFNRLTNAFDRVCIWVLQEARKLLKMADVAKMYQIMVGMFLGFTHPHVEVIRIPERPKPEHFGAKTKSTPCTSTDCAGTRWGQARTVPAAPGERRSIVVRHAFRHGLFPVGTCSGTVCVWRGVFHHIPWWYTAPTLFLHRSARVLAGRRHQ